MNILLTGANGMLGRSVQNIARLRYKKYNVFVTDVKNLDITDYDQLAYFFSGNSIDWIINCAAYTNVDACENNYALANKINADGPANLAAMADKHNCKFVHISTDYVYNSDSLKSLDEDAKLNPISAYGRSKLNGEFNVMQKCRNYFILRSSWMFGYYGENFLRWIITNAKNNIPLKLITDNYGNPTYSIRLAEVILKVLDTENYGIYNFCNDEYTNWYEFGKYIVEAAGLKTELVSIKASDLGRPAARPKYSAMNTSKIKRVFNISIPDWRDDVEACLKKFKFYLK